MAGAEAFLATQPKPSRGLPQRLGGRSVRLREHPPGQDLYLVPPEAHAETADSLERRKYHFSTDGGGFIGPIEEGASRKIVFLGGSTTECMYVDEERRFPYLVGKMLGEELGETVAAYNGGVSGNTSMHSNNILLNKVLPMNPDVVVLHHNINDLSVLMLEGTYWNRNPSRSLVVEKDPETAPSIFFLLKKVKDLLIPNLYVRVKALFGLDFGDEAEQDEWAEQRGKRIGVREAAVFSAFGKSLQVFVDICKAHGIKPVLMTQASRLKESPDPVVRLSFERLERDFGISYTTYRGLHEGMNQVIRTVAQENGIQCIDLAGRVPRESAFLYDFAHYNEKGSALAAEIIADELARTLKRQSSARPSM
jgi:lysophospholipase L1-like esterase